MNETKREVKIENARITSTKLGKEDHGIFSAYIFLEGDGWGCGFGGYALDSYDKEKKRRVGSDFGCEFIMQLLETLEVETWEDLKGKLVRVKTEGWGGRVRKIGHVIKDKWFDPKALAEQYEEIEQ